MMKHGAVFFLLLPFDAYGPILHDASRRGDAFIMTIAFIIVLNLVYKDRYLGVIVKEDGWLLLS